MFTITGITGTVGGVVARTLLAANQSVRAVVRDVPKGAVWAERGCDVAIADFQDTNALVEAFRDSSGVFVLVPPNFDPEPGFPEARRIAATLRAALERAQPEKVVYLSTIGAQATQESLLTQHTLIEQMLGEVSLPITFLRPGWFMENSLWDVAPARAQGVIPSFLQPLDKPVPMVATADIGQVAAQLLQTSWSGNRVIELEGPRRVAPNEIAAVFTALLDRNVKMEAVPRETWEHLFKSQGMKNPTPRIQMLDGFNEGWIEFARGEAGSQKGSMSLENVLKTLIER